MKQTFHCKGAQGINEGGKEEQWEQFYDLDGTKVKKFPIPESQPLEYSTSIEQTSAKRLEYEPSSVISRPRDAGLADALEEARAREDRLLRTQISAQEELDWHCYRLYGLLEEHLTFPIDEVPEINLGERAFEVVLARKVAAGEAKTEWFARHGSTPITEIPEHWPEAYRDLVERRIAKIEEDRNIRLCEKPEHKRRWATEQWEKRQERALKEWMLDRLEAPELWSEGLLTTTSRLADQLRRDDAFREVAELYAGSADVSLEPLLRDLMLAESVPYLTELRFKPPGLRKRHQWEATWDLQRQEDAIDARTELPEDHPDHLTAEEAQRKKAEDVGDIPVPPKYASSDFASTTAWKMRGKLDVPKERFHHYPEAEREADPTPVVGWAGWNHLQRAQALATYYLEVKDNEAWPADRLRPLLQGLRELLPWLRQWHNEMDPAIGMGMGDYYAGFVEEESRSLT